MKLKAILRLIPGSQLITIVDDERVILEGWEAYDAWSKVEEIKEEYLDYDVIRIETFQDKLKIRILNY